MLARTSKTSAAANPPGDTPIRTCVGCRQRVSWQDVMRVVVVAGALVPDLQHRLPGRGAWLHLDPECLRLAQRRRAFPRALRADGPLEDTELVQCIVGLDGGAPEQGGSDERLPIRGVATKIEGRSDPS